MKQVFWFSVLCSCFFCIPLFAQEAETDSIQLKQVDSLLLYDGPYVFIKGDSLIETTINNGETINKLLFKNSFPLKFKSHNDHFKNVTKVAAISDIHGQFEIAKTLLINHKIIDENLNWTYGNGHLVITGDIFDRGDKVNEVLWLIYNIEQQAINAGGMVHYLMGNHEYMVFLEDYRYVNPKYLKVAELLGQTYAQLYGPNTVLGRWLRSKHTAVQINDNLFVHGGFSKNFIEDGFKLKKVNQLMRSSIDDVAMLDNEEFFKKYYGSDGPIWYRGYFYDDLPESHIDSILTKVKSDHLVVGHCSFDSITKRYNGKIYGVDSSIKLGKSGEILFIDAKGYRRGLFEGKIVPFKEEEDD